MKPPRSPLRAASRHQFRPLLRLIRERAAREAAEAAERRATFLAEPGQALASAPLDEQAVANTLARLVVPFLGRAPWTASAPRTGWR